MRHGSLAVPHALGIGLLSHLLSENLLSLCQLMCLHLRPATTTQTHTMSDKPRQPGCCTYELARPINGLQAYVVIGIVLMHHLSTRGRKAWPHVNTRTPVI